MLLHFVGRQLAPDAQKRVEGRLNELGSMKNPFLNAYYLEALEAVGADFADADAVGRLRAHIEHVLTEPTDPDRQQQAYGIVSSQFEALSAISDPACQAIEELSSERHRQLLAMAALGAPEWGWNTGFCLHGLLQRVNPLGHLVDSNGQGRSSGTKWGPEACSDKTTISAFERWAQAPEENRHRDQERAYAFSLAHQGLALCRQSPRGLEGPALLRDAAWNRFGHLTFVAARAALGVLNKAEAELASQSWSVLAGELSGEAAEPLIMLLDRNLWLRGGPVLPTFEQVWPEQVARLALQLLKTTDLNARGLFEPVGAHLIRIVGKYGDATSRGALLALVDHPAFGAAAHSAVQALDSRYAESLSVERANRPRS